MAVQTSMLGLAALLLWGMCLQLALAASSSEKQASLKWKDCGNQSHTWIQFTSLEVSPQPLQLPGSITLTLEGKTTLGVSGTLALDVLIEEKFSGGFAKIPCRKGYGSCRFEDICSSLRYLRVMSQCPDVMTKAGLVCACPGANELIRISNAVIEVPEVTSSWKWLKFPPEQQNEFRVRVSLVDAGKSVRGCLEASLHVQG